VRENRRDIARRSFLGSVALGTSALLARPARAGPDGAPLLVIDAHAHVYGDDESAYPIIEKPYRPPAGTGTVAHLLREMETNGVTRVTVVQASTFYRWDNRFLTDTARQNRDVMAGVCTLDPDDPASPALLEKYVRESNVRGMRSVPARSGRLDDPGVDALWAAAERLGIVINVLANRDRTDEVLALARRHPGLRLVLDHGLNLKSGPTLEPTLRDLERLAQLPQVHAKLTFVPTGSAEPYPCREMHEPCRRVIAAFGPDRCVWGSDFPCELWCPKVTYTQHLAIFTRELGLAAGAKAAILGETARRLWFARPD
jgi:predicted TIM-barrel fold metal-dependent hydrolase